MFLITADGADDKSDKDRAQSPSDEKAGASQ